MYPKEEALLDFYNSHPTGGQVTNSSKLKRTAEILETDISGSVLDLGCAQGHTCKHALKLGAEKSLGVDFSEERIKEGKKMYQEIELVCMDLHKFVETTNLTFDRILLFDTIEHLEKPEELIRNAKKLLNDGGCIISSTPLAFPYEAHLQVFKDVEDFFDKLSPNRAVEDRKSILARWDK